MSQLLTMTPAVRKKAEMAAATNRTTLGFWIYLMTDCVLFASLFATYAVLHANTNGGHGSELFSLPFVLIETVLLLTSSFSCGLALIGLQNRSKRLVMASLGLTFALGLAFVIMELSEFRHLVVDGNSWRGSAFLSSYFTLVGTHGLHITVGLLWLAVLLWQLNKKGLQGNMAKRLTLFSLFWHFLDLIWIFIFSVVYLWGKVL